MKTNLAHLTRGLATTLILFALTLSAQVIEPDRTIGDHIAYAQSSRFDAVRNSVFQVETTWGDGTTHRFNGFYLGMGNQVGFVTAAHGLNHDVASARLIFGPDSANPSRVIELSSWLMHPGYGATIGDVNDIALMTPADTSAFYSLTPIPMFSGTPSVGDPLYTIGYGRWSYPGTGVFEENSLQSGFENRISSFGYSEYSSQNVMVRFDSTDHPSRLLFEGIGLPGWSGSVKLAYESGELQAVALTEFVSNGYTPSYGTREGSLLLGTQAPWLAQEMFVIPEPSAMAWSGCGLVALIWARRRGLRNEGRS